MQQKANEIHLLLNSEVLTLKDVKIIESKAGYFATLKYGGYSNSFKVESNTNKLYKILKEKNIEIVGEPSYVSYNSPFKFFSRRNEIIIEIRFVD